MNKIVNLNQLTRDYFLASTSEKIRYAKILISNFIMEQNDKFWFSYNTVRLAVYETSFWTLNTFKANCFKTLS